MLQSQVVVLECVVSVVHVLRMSSFCYDHHACLLLKQVTYINTTEGGICTKNGAVYVVQMCIH